MSVATYAAARLIRLLPRNELSRAVGRLCDRRLPAPLSRAVQQTYVRAFGVDMAEAEPVRGAYPSFDAFFTRPLRAGSRLIEDARVVSPADGQLVDSGAIDLSARLTVKGQPYSVHELIGEPAGSYAGGSYAVVYLSPRDYHRVHSPVDGVIRRVRGISGDLYPVNAIGERHVSQLFVKNERVVSFVDSDAVGRVAVVMVGAIIVGRMTVSMLPGAAVAPGDHPIEPPARVERGDEIGMFHLGSTVVLLVEKDADLSQHPRKVLYGQALSGKR